MSIQEDIVVFVVGFVCLLYLLNPTMGVFELIPDNIPLIGNLDEVGATALLFYSLRYFGFDIINLFNNFNRAQDRNGGGRRRND